MTNVDVAEVHTDIDNIRHTGVINMCLHFRLSLEAMTKLPSVPSTRPGKTQVRMTSVIKYLCLNLVYIARVDLL